MSPERLKILAWSAIAGVLGLALMTLAVTRHGHQSTASDSLPQGLLPPPIQRHIDTCASQGISTAAAREGTCLRSLGWLGGPATYNVVDAGHVLHMPGYDARLLHSMVQPTLVGHWRTHPGAYPGGHGLLVSFEVSVSNRTAHPLWFDRGGDDVDLLIPNLDAPGQSIEMGDSPNVKGAPGQSVADLGPIEPAATVTGWTTFVAPVWTMSVVRMRSDLNFFVVGAPIHAYIGQIRVWKWATPQGKAALALTAYGNPYDRQPGQASG